MRLGMENTCCGLNLTNTVGAEQLHSVIRSMVGRLKVEHVTLLSRCSKNAAAVEPECFLFVKIRESYELCLSCDLVDVNSQFNFTVQYEK